MDGDLIDAYVAEMRALGWAASTTTLRAHQLKRWRHALGERDVTQANRRDVVEYLGRFAAAETRYSARAAIAGLYRWAVDTGAVASDPTARLPRQARPMTVPRPIPDVIFARGTVYATPREHAMLVLGRYSGLRASEIAAVHRRDLAGEVGRETLRVLGKGGRTRVLPAHQLVVEVVTAADAWVFPSQRHPSGHITGPSVTDMISDLLPGSWTCHALRHAYATQAYRDSGNDLRLVQQLLGHSSPTTTARYVLVDDDRAGAVVRSLHVPGAALLPTVPGMSRRAA